jgi:hypothetical protein
MIEGAQHGCCAPFFFSVTNKSPRMTRCSDWNSSLLLFEQHVASAHEDMHTLPFAS